MTETSTVTAATLLAALRQKHSGDAVVREVVIDDPYEFAIRRRAEIERARSWGEDQAEMVERRYVEQGKLIADAVPDGWNYRASKPQRRIDALIIASTGTTAVEIKVTRADFRRDTDEKRRAWRAITNRFVYLVPKGLVALEEVADGCGLWEFDADAHGKYRWQHGIVSVKRATTNKSPDPLPFQITRSLAYRVSNHERQA
ncbi:hypothetical protein JNB63_02070 [Microbacterium trichothecenolyticum]|uniref:hypothetical protein n=1 Tax=Microbacterium trichothecenolyticum TaxID=69370 RepID=UPI001C6EFEC4|nr:hypothetical protein [Microbacterium trichothecenolyticum]MBW9118872.1 hypothetical protein [Microbacterium trichothecenolyticum]